MELIRISNLYKTYYLGEVDVPVLRGISLTINHGEMVALMGASGSGKTTLMNILGCLDRPTSGEFWLDGQEMSQLTPNERALVRTDKLGFVFQSFNLLPRTTALNNVLMPLDYSPNIPASGEAKRLAKSLLNRVGLGERLDHEPSQMSGGQQQRVAIARALVNRPALVLADEPTGNLDSKTSIEILQMFRELNAAGITVVLVTHDPKVGSFADRVIRLKDGQVESDGPPETSAHGLPGGETPGNGNGSGNGNGHKRIALASGRDTNGSGAQADQHANGNGHSSRQAQTAAALASTAANSGAVAVAMAEPVAPKTHPAVEVANPDSIYDYGSVEPSGKSLAALFPATFRTAVNALRRNKMRSLLTALGVIIGVGAVIAMMEIGQGSKAALQKTIASMGANVLLVQSGAASNGGVSYGSGSVLTLKPQDADEILLQCPAVTDVAPVVRSGRAQLVYLNRNYPPSSMYGTTPAYLIVRDWEELEEGEMFSDRDVSKAAQVCVVGETIKREVFMGESPVGKDIRIQNVSLRVIGVLSRKGANMLGMDQDDIVVAPWTTVKYRISGSSSANQTVAAAAASSSATSETVNSLDNLYPGGPALYPVPSATEAADRPQPVRFTSVEQIMVKAASTEEIPDAIAEITSLLHERHHIREGQADDFNIRDMTELTNTMAQQSQLMGMLLLVVALISLVVGGVGIMNIMLVSVTERTREIGLRMAVGARSKHILRQFLVEAVVLCLIGGATGILLGRGASWLVRMIMNWPTQLSIPAIVAAVAVSATVGVVFGFYPAWKASKLDPIEALRYE